MVDVDSALGSLQKIQADFSDFCLAHGKITEADTRVKLIDRILKEVCDWPESAIIREEHTDRGYIDYILSLPTRRTLVIEAKREGIPFILPKALTQRTFKLTGAMLSDVAVREAIMQVRGYCDDAGIRHAVATNGYAWIVFRAIRDDMPWRDGKARVFPSLEYIHHHFVDFWNLLSYTSVASGSLEEEFGVARRPLRSLFRVSDRLFNADLPLQRNRLHAQLAPVIRTIFADIADQADLEILQSCYVHSASLRIVADDLNCVINDSIPKFLESEGAEPLLPDSPRFSNVISKAMEAPRGELFLVLGGIGSGKTTFLKRYQRTVGRDLLDSKSLWFHVDFLKAPLDPMELEEYVLRELLSQLRTRYKTPHLETRRNIKRVFSDDIAALRQTNLRHYREGSDEFERALSPYLEKWQQNLQLYVPGLLRLCKPRRDLAVVLFVDNVDQLPPAYQAQIFLLAQRLTRLIECATIVTLREESYYATSVQRSFTAYSNKKFHIASPHFRVLISSRISYALRVLQLSAGEMEVILSSGIALDRDAIADFLRIVQTSIFQGNAKIAQFIEAICFGNMRLALQMFATFLTSGAADVDKMIRIYRREGAYYVAYHEFVKSIMLGDRQYYKDEQSPIMNLFDCGSQRNSSHFTAARVMGYLRARRSEASSEGQGYVSIGEIVGLFEDVFDNLEDCVRNLNRLVARQLIEVNSRSTESIEGASHARLASAGWYYRKYLLRSFPYLDLVLQDTPFSQASVEAELRRRVSEVGNLSDREDQKIDRMEVRFARVETFLSYLSSEESSERTLYGLNEISGPVAEPIIPAVSEAFKKQRGWIRRRLREDRERYEDEVLLEEPDEVEESATDNLEGGS